MYQTGVLTTYTMCVLIISNEIKIFLLLTMVVEFGFMWFPDVVFGTAFRQIYTSQNL